MTGEQAMAECQLAGMRFERAGTKSSPAYWMTVTNEYGRILSWSPSTDRQTFIQSYDLPVDDRTFTTALAYAWERER